MSTDQFTTPFPQRTVRDLEFEKIREQVVSRTLSVEGRELVSRQAFSTDIEQIRGSHLVTEEILRFWSQSASHFSDTLPDIRQAMEKAAVAGTVCDGEELYAIGSYVSISKSLKSHYSEEFDDVIHFQELIHAIPDTAEIIHTIFTVLESPGKVRETHPAIRPILRQIERARSDRAATADRAISQQPDLFQSDRAAFRDDRIVLSLKREHRSAMEGVVHGYSGTGATIYVEPFELVKLNNNLSLLEQQLQIEIHRLYRELTEYIHHNRELIAEIMASIGEVDACLAKAAYARATGCSRPELYDLSSEKRGITLVAARHPLLYGEAVPISLTLPPDCSAMIMSGPNAGGKTVTLKTVGILVLMNQFGLLLPAAEGTKLCVYDSIFTDIGDEQSIEGALSTFSSHLSHIGDIFSDRGLLASSLVILDELGSGTDPVQGAALARSILEELLDTTALTMITSHHSVLKQFGYVDARIINASMEFDDTSKTPTFAVITGLPGESHAIETAERMHLPERVIARAKSYLSDESVEISAIIRGLKEKEREVSDLQEELSRRNDVVKGKSRELDLKMLTIRQRERLKEKERLTEFEVFAAGARKQLENLVRELREGELNRRKTSAVKQYISELDSTIAAEQQLQMQKSEERADSGGDTFEFTVGQTVRSISGNREGIIVKRDRKGSWAVMFDSLRIVLPEGDLRPVAEKSERSTRYSAGSSTHVLQTEAPRFTIDVRGQTLEEALRNVDTQLDRAVVAGIDHFSIIHGKGTGVLQQGIRDHLSAMTMVKSISFARPEEGGYGKSIVYLA